MKTRCRLRAPCGLRRSHRRVRRLRLRQRQRGVSDLCCGRGRDRRSGGRSRHGTAMDRFADGATSVRAAQSAARSPRPVSRGADCSWNKPQARPASFALLAIGTGLDAAEGEHAARGPVPPRFPPLDVIAEITHLFEYPRTGIILRCDVSWLPTRNRCIGSGPQSAIS
jgi:hypothetical protein